VFMNCSKNGSNVETALLITQMIHFISFETGTRLSAKKMNIS
jgi:hypothetical protein